MQLDEGDVPNKADVELRLPADGAYVSVLRTAAAGLAARLDFTIDDIEDLRMAVGEASAMVLRAADPESDLYCAFHLAPRQMTVALSVDTASAPEPAYDSFAWQVLTTLASSVEARPDSGRFTLTLTLASAVVAADA